MPPGSSRGWGWAAKVGTRVGQGRSWACGSRPGTKEQSQQSCPAPQVTLVTGEGVSSSFSSPPLVSNSSYTEANHQMVQKLRLIQLYLSSGQDVMLQKSRGLALLPILTSWAYLYWARPSLLPPGQAWLVLQEEGSFQLSRCQLLVHVVVTCVRAFRIHQGDPNTEMWGRSFQETHFSAQA